MYIIVFVTASNKKEAKNIATALIQKKLAACVNIISGIESIFRWQQKIERAKETLLVIKSKKSKLPRIIRVVKSLHSYDTPEIIAIALLGGEKKYLNWIDESLG